MPLFSIEEKYQDYLVMVKLDESKMSETQKVETKQAFMAGMSTMFALIGFAIADMDDNSANDAINGLNEQLGEYWLHRGGQIG